MQVDSKMDAVKGEFERTFAGFSHKEDCDKDKDEVLEIIKEQKKKLQDLDKRS